MIWEQMSDIESVMAELQETMAPIDHTLADRIIW
jgi:hypothetical protein